jgi:hypothetical protein
MEVLYMSNLEKVKTEPVYVELGGKQRRLKYDMNAFALLEKRYGSIDKAMDVLQEGTIVGFQFILWAGLVHEEIKEREDFTGEPLSYNINVYDVGSWIEPQDFGPVMIKLTQALTGAIPKNLTVQTTSMQPAMDPVERVLLDRELAKGAATIKPGATSKN